MAVVSPVERCGVMRYSRYQELCPSTLTIMSLHTHIYIRLLHLCPLMQRSAENTALFSPIQPADVIAV